MRNWDGKTFSNIFWFLRSYLTKRTFYENIGKDSSSPGELACGVPQGSILGPLIFLFYVNDMLQSLDCDFLLYADDSCLVFGDNAVNEIEKQLNRNFNSLCDWFVDNKLSNHFGEDKTKSILFGRKINKPAVNIWTLEEVTLRSKNIRQSHTWAVSWTRDCLVNQWLPGPLVKSMAGSNSFTESKLFLIFPFGDY